MNSVTEKSFKKETIKKAKSKKKLPKDLTTSSEAVDPQSNLNPNKKQAPLQKTTVVDETAAAAKPAVDAKGAENTQITPNTPATDTAPSQVTAPAATPVTIDPLASQPAAPVSPAVPAINPAAAPTPAPATSAIPATATAPAVAAAEVGGGIPWTYILGGVGAAGGLAALGGGGGGSTPPAPAPATKYPLNGVVSDGYVSGAEVYVDNGTTAGIIDGGDTFIGTTDANGAFTNSSFTTNYSGSALLAKGGTNVDTGLANTLTLRAQAGSTVINPLTTLLASAPGLTEKQLLSSLGLTQVMSGKSIISYDPLLALKSNPTDATALAVQAAAAQVVVIATAGAVTPADIATKLAGIATTLAASTTPSFSQPDSSNLISIAGVNTPEAASIAAIASASKINASALSTAQLAAGLPSLLSDTGISSTDKTTSNGALTAAGAGMAVEYSLDGGAWGSTYTIPPVDGSYTVQIRQVGAAADKIATLNFILDTQVAVAITSGTLTNDTTPVISGTAEAGASVTVGIAGETYTTVATGGVWSIDTATATTVSGATLVLNTAGTNNVSVTATDTAGNTSVAAQTFTIDVNAPTLSITSDVPAVNAGQTATITFTFSKAPVGFTAADVATTGGGLTDPVVDALNPLVYTAIFTPTPGIPSGTASITVAGGYTDAAGNQGGAGTTPSISIDTLAPTLTITSDPATLTVGQTATITFTFSEIPTDFLRSDVDVAGGTLGALAATTDSKIFTAIFTPTAGVEVGTASISVVSGKYTDAALNLGGDGTTPAITYDTMVPTVTIKSDLPALKIGETAKITFTFNEQPLNFVASDVAFTGGVLSGFTSTNDPLVYNAIFTPDADVAAGAASITVAAGAYTGLKGNLGAEGTTPAISIDTLAPTLAITSGGVSAVNVGQTATITFTFTEAPNGFTSANVVTKGGDLTGFAANAQNPLEYTAIFTPSAGIATGAASITVAGGYTDAAGNPGAAGSTPAISIDTLAPTLSITSDVSAVNVGQTALITFTFSEAPVGFTAANVNTTGGGLTGLAVNAQNPLEYTAVFTPTPDTATGTASITVAGGYADAAGNLGGAGSTPSISIDTLTPVAPALTVVTNAANATQAEATTGAVTVTAEVGSTISVVFANGANSVTKTLTADGMAQAVALAAGDITTLGNGIITVNATTTDVAKNVSVAATQASFTLDTAAPAAPVFALVAGADLATSAEAIAGAVTVTAENGSSVSVTFTNGANASVTKTLIGNGSAQLIALDAVAGDLTTLGDGSITVTASATDVAGNVRAAAAPASFVLDTTIGGLSAVHVGADSVMNPAEVFSATHLTLVPVANVTGETVQSVTISGAVNAGGTSPQTATQVNGIWSFDATPFAFGTLTVTTVTTDTAGNTITNNFTLENIAQSLVNSVTSTDGDNFINIGDTAPNGLTTTILVLPAGGDTINTVTISGTPSVPGGQNSVVASAGTVQNTYFFNSNLFADGQLTVLVNVTTPPPAVTTLDAAPFFITKDTSAPLAPTVLVVAGVGATATEVGGATATEAMAGAVTVNAEALSTVVVSFTNGSKIVNKTLTADGTAQAVTLTSADLSTLGNGTINVNATTTDTAHNVSTAAAATSFVLDTVPPTLSITSDVSAVNVGQTALITFTFSEAPVGFTAANVNTTGGGLTGLAVNAQNPLEYTAVFTPTPDTATGTASITVAGGYTDAAGNLGGAGLMTTPPSISIDTLAPVAPTLVVSVATANATEAEALAGAVTVSAELGSTVSVIFSTGTASVTKTLTADGTAQAVALAAGDITTLGNGTISVNATTTDVAGNASVAATQASFTLYTSAPAAPTLVVSAATANATEAEALAGAVTVSAELGSTVSVIFSTGTASVTKTLIADGTAQTVALATGDLFNLGNGTISVNATVTDVAGNVSVAAAPASFILDTLAPVAPTFAVVAGAASATTAEALAGAVTVTAEVGSSVSVTFSNGANTVTKTLLGTGVAQTVALAAGDLGLTGLADGTITVSATATDVAGNTSQVGTSSFILDTAAPVAPTLLVSATAANATAAEATTGAVTVTAESGSTASVTFTNNAGVSVIKTVIGTGGVQSVALTQADLNALGNGTITVSATTTDVAGNVSVAAAPTSFILDTLAPVAPTFAVVAGAASATAAEAMAGAVSVTAEAGSTVSVTLTGNTGNVTKTLTGNAAAQAVVLTLGDLTILGDGAISVSATATDVAGNTSATATPASFILDTAVPVAPALVVSATNANATAFEATNGAVTVSAEAGSTVVVTFTNGLNSVTKTLTGSVSPQPVALAGADFITLGNGTIIVSATATDVAGNVSSAGTNSFILDTAAPVAPVLFVSATNANATAAEAIAGAVTVNAEVGSTIFLTFSGSLGSVFTTQTGAGTAQAVALTQAQLDSLGNGPVTVSASTTDVAGNVSPASNTTSFVLDMVAPVAPVLVLAAGAAIATAAEATAGAVTVTAEFNSNISVVFSSILGNVTKTLTGNGTAQTVALTSADLITLGDGAINVSATTTGVAGNASATSTTSFVLDTYIGGLSGVLVGVDAVINPAEVSAATPLTLVPVLNVTGETVLSVTISGAATGGGTSTQTASQNVNGNWFFDATPFVVGTLAVTTVTVDTAGNTLTGHFTLNNISQPNVNSVTSLDGDVFINIFDAAAAPNTLLVLPAAGDTINTVTISGTPAVAGGATSVVATAAAAVNTYNFNSNLFADGQLTILVNVTTAGTTVNAAPFFMTKDTLAPNAPTVVVLGAAADATAAEAINGAVTVTAETGSSVSVTFTNGVGAGAKSVTKTLLGDAVTAQAVTLTAADLIALGNGTITVNATTMDAAHNVSGAATTTSFVLDTVAPVVPTLAVATGAANSTAAEAIAGAVTVTAEAGSSVSVTFTGTKGSIIVPLIGDATAQAVLLTQTNLTTLGDGLVSVTATATDVAGNISVAAGGSFNLDTVAPLGTTLTLVTGAANATAAEVIAGAVTITAEAGAAVSVTFTGVNGPVTKTLVGTGAPQTVTLAAGEPALLGEGSVAVSATVTDVAGNISVATPVNFILDTAVPVAPIFAVVANADLATAAEAITGAVTVSAEAGSALSVTFSNGINSVTKNLTGAVAAQRVALTQADINALGNGTISVTATSTDLAGNVSNVGNTSFILDTVAPAAPSFAVVAGAANATAAEATAGAVTVNAEAGASVSVTFTGTLGNVTKTLIGSGAPQAVSLAAGDLTILGDGSITVDAIATGVAGNVSQAATQTSFFLDTVAPLAPALLVSVTTANATAAEATSGAVTVSAEAGSTVVVTFTNGANVVSKTLTGTVAGQLVALAGPDLTTLGNGTITVSATATDGAGNTSVVAAATSFILDTSAPLAPVFAVVAGADLATAAEALAGAVTVTAEAGANVSVTFSNNGVNPVTKTLLGTGVAQTVVLAAGDLGGLTGLADGIITVRATATDVAGNTSLVGTSSFTLDTIPQAAPTIVVSAATANATAASAGAVTVTTDAGSTVTVTFTDGTNIVTKTLSSAGVPQPVVLTAGDLASLGNGTITVSAAAVGPAGNPSPAATANFILDTAAPVAPVLVVSAATANAIQAEALAGAVTVTAEVGSTVAVTFSNGANAVTKTLLNATGQAQAVLLLPGDLTTLGNGTITVTATSTDVAGNISATAAPASFILDTLAPVQPTLAVVTGADLANASEAAAGAVTVTAGVGSTISVTFTDGVNSVTKTLAATGAVQAVALATADIALLATGLINTPISVSATSTDVAGNVSAPATANFSLDTLAPAAPTLLVSAANAYATASEALVGAVSVTAEAGSTVFLTFASATGSVIKTLNGSTGAAQDVALTLGDLATLGNGTINVNATIADAAGNVSSAIATTSFIFDTAAPNAPALVVSATTANATAAEATTGAVTVTAEQGSSISVKFTNAANNTVTKLLTGTGLAQAVALDALAGDLTTLGDGPITVSASTTDIAGNVSAAAALTSFILDTATPAVPTFAIVAGAGFATAAEAMAGAVTVNAENGSTVSVTFANTNGTASVTKTLTGNAGAQIVALTQADLNILGNGPINVSGTSTDVAGNVSTALPASFELDTVVAAPVLVVSAATANATAAEATAGAVTVTAETGSTVTVKFTNAANVAVTKTLIGSVLAQVVALDAVAGDLTTLGDGPITVSATATDVAGNVSVAATPASFILDTLPPAAPTFVVSAPNLNATSAEAIAGAVTVTADALSTITVTLTGTNGFVIKTLIGTGLAQAVTLDAVAGDLTTLGQGAVTVTATATDVAGNLIAAATPASFILDTAAPTTPVLALVAGANLATSAEATTGAVTVTAENGSTLSVTFSSVLGSVTKTLTGNVVAQPVALTAGDLITLGDGAITVSATATDVAGNTSAAAASSFVLDTTIGGLADVLVGNDRFMNPIEVSTTTPLTLVPVANVAGETVTSVTVIGNVPAAAGGASITRTANFNLLNGNWEFDATPFDTVQLTVRTITVDTAGNTITKDFFIQNSLQPTLNGVTSADGNVYINLAETMTGGIPSLSTILVLPVGTDTIDSVHIAGTPSGGGAAITVTAVIGATANTYTFDTTLFAEGQLSVTAFVRNSAGVLQPESQPFTLTKDTLVPNAPTVLVVPAATNATASEAINGAVTVTAETGSSVSVTFTNVANLAVTKTLLGNVLTPQAVTLTAADLIALGNGTITVNATTTDVAGNVSGAATTTSFVLDTAAPVAPALVVSATNANATSAEAITGAVTVSAEAGSTISVTFTNGLNSITKTLLNATGTAQAVSLLAGDLTTLGNGTISVTATTTDVAGNVSAAGAASFILDMAVPLAPVFAVVAGADLATAAEAIAGAVTVTAETGANVSVIFTNITTNLTVTKQPMTATGLAQVVALTAGEVAALGQGTIVVSATATDVAGNTSPAGTNSFILDTVQPAAPTFAVVAGAATATEAFAGAVTVTAEFNALVSVTFTNAANNTAVTKQLIGSGNAQPVVLAAGDLTTLGDGTITVSATATGAAGNVSLASTPTSFILDTAPPVAPTLAVVAVGVASAAEAIAGAVTVTAEAGSTVSVTFSNGVNPPVTKTLLADGTAQTVTLTAGDLGTLGQGAITVTATTTDVAGNLSASAAPASFTLDSLTPGFPVFAVMAASATEAEATTGTGAVTVTAEAGSTVSVVFSNGVNTVTKTLPGISNTGVAQAVTLLTTDLPTLGNGLISVSATATDAAGNVSVAATPASFTLDTLAPVAPTFVVSAATANATVAEALAGAVTVTAELGSTVTVNLTGSGQLGTVQKILTGTGVAQAVVLTSADLLNLGSNGTITVNATSTDVAGNVSVLAAPAASFILDNVLPNAPTLAVSVATADATSAEATTGAVTVSAELNSTISVVFTNGANSVTKTLLADGTAQAVALAAGDITTLGNGTISVNATTTDVAGNVSVAATPAASFILDTLAPVAPALVVSATTANATSAEAIAGAVTVTAEAGSAVTVTFTGALGGTVSKTLPGGISNTGAAQAVALAGPDLTTLGEGTVTVTATTTDVAGNVSVAATPASFILDTLPPAAPTFVVSVTNTNATQAEALAGAVTVTAEVGSTISVTFANTNGVNLAVTKTLTASGLAQAVTLLAGDLTTLGDGTISVNATTTDVAGNVSVAATPASFILDTLAPPAPVLVVSAATANAIEAEALAGAVTVTAELGSTVVVTFSNGVNTVTKTLLNATGLEQAVLLALGDLTTLGNGTISVSAIATDVAGNVSVAAAPASFILDTLAPVAPSLVVSAATASATAAEAIAGAVTVTAEAGSTVVVTFARALGGSVTKTLIGTGLAQAVTLDAATNDLTILGNGLITVNATTTDVAGNISVAATPASFILDTSAPLAPALVVSATTANATAAEAITGAVSVSAELNSTISVTFANGLINVTKTLIADGLAQAVALTQAELNTLGNGIISVNATTTDVAGNVSVAAIPASFILDTLAPVAPTFVVSATTANATAAEATAGAVTVTAEALSTVTVTFTGALGGTVSKTLPGITNTGVAQAVTLLAGDLTTLGEGTVTVTATTTDVAGNVSVAATPASFILDTLPPVAPTLAAAVTVVGIASAAEAIAGAVTVTAEAGSTIAVTFTGSVGAVIKALTGTGAAQTVTLLAGDLALIGDGNVTVSATTTDVAGNISQPAVTTSFVMDSVVALPVVTLNVDSGVSLIDNITNNGTVAVGAVEAGALVQYSSDGGANWLNNFTAVEGLNSVAVRQTDLAGNFATTIKNFTLDTQVAGVSNVLVGTDAVILQAEALAQTPLTAVPVAGATGESVTAISIAGTAAVGGALTQAATLVAGNWVFDSTLFADGLLTVSTATLDIAGNTRTDISTLTKNTVPTGTVTVTAGNDAFIKLSETQGGSTTLNVVAGANDTVHSVTVNGFAANGTTPVSAVANHLGGGLYNFNVSLFGDGSLNVIVNMTSAGLTFDNTKVLTKDVVIGGVTSLDVGGDAFVSVAENTTATPFNIVVPGVGEAVSVVVITDINGLSANASLIAGVWKFNSVPFANGALTVQTTTVDAAGNSFNNTFTLTKSGQAVLAGATVGVDTYVNSIETTATTVLNLQPGAGDTVNTVTITGVSAAVGGGALTLGPITSTANSVTFDATQFADGLLTVTATVTGTSGTGVTTLPVTVTKDTLITGVVSVNVGADAIISAAEATATTLLSLPVLAAGETVQSISIDGISASTGLTVTQPAIHQANGNWVFDATQFANGALSVLTTTVDTAGNTITNLPFTLTKASPPLVSVNAGGDAFINFTENTAATTLNVVPTGTDTLNSVTITGLSATAGVGQITTGPIASIGNSVTFDATPFAEGTLTVTANVTTATGVVDALPVSLTKDTLNSGVASVTVGADTAISPTEATAATVLTLQPVAGAVNETVTGISITGTPLGAGAATQAASLVAGNWVFDATQFALGQLTVVTTTTDTAGNSVNNTFNLTKTGAATVSSVTVGGDAIINAAETLTVGGTILNVTPVPGDTINSVTVSQQGANSVQALLVSPGVYSFDAASFAEGTLSVTATVSGVSGTLQVALPVTLTKDTSVAGVATVQVGTDTIISAAEALQSTALTLAPGAGAIAETVTSVTVSGTALAGTALTVNATGAGNNWTFNSTLFKDGPLSVNTVTNDTSGNTRTNNFSLSKNTAVAGSIQVLEASGDAFINSFEVGGTIITLNTLDTVNSLTISGVDTTGAAIILSMAAGDVVGFGPNATNPLLQEFWFDTAPFADGVLTVTADVTPAVGGATFISTSTLTLDTALPGVTSVTVGGDALIGPAEMIAVPATATNLARLDVVITPVAGLGETVQTLIVSGTNAMGVAVATAATKDGNGIWTFDAIGFADGQLSVATHTVDAAGNFFDDTKFITLSAQVIVNSVTAGGDTIIDRAEASNGTLTVTPVPGDFVNYVVAGGVPISGVKVSGTDTAGTPNFFVFATDDGTNTNTYTFDATLFADGPLSVTVEVYGVSGGVDPITGLQLVDQTTGLPLGVNALPINLTKDSLIAGIANVNVGTDAIILGAEATVATALTLIPRAGAAGETVLSVTITDVAGVVAPVIATGGGNNWSFNAAQFANGNLNVNISSTDAAGNLRNDDIVITKSATSTAITAGGTTLVDVNNSVYQDVAGSNDTFSVLANTNAAVLAGAGNDTVALAAAAATALFARLDGGAGTADVLQLSGAYNGINLALFNNANQPVIKGFEVIDLATDAGINVLTLTAADLFNLGSLQVDALTSAQMLTITGAVNDTVNCGVVATATDGLFTQTAGAFNIDGTANVAGGYSKYASSYTDAGGFNHQLELLIQNGVVVA